MRLTIKCCFNLLFLFSVFLVSTVEAQICTPAAPGLVSWWSGDGNALDSRSRNNGTLQNGATFAAGHVGQAFSLDGIDDRVTIGNPDNLNFGFGDFSIQVWVRTSFLGGTFGDMIVSKISTGNDVQFQLGYDAGGTGFPTFTMSDSVNSTTVSGKANLADGNFHLLAAVRNGTTLRLYVDGEEVGSATTAALISASSGNNVVIGGRDNPNFDPYFNGLIDEVQFFDRALSASEIQSAFNSGTAGVCKPTATVAPSGVVGWWSGDGDANDISGFDNDGGLFNGASIQIGRVGQAFNFDGVDDVVRIGNQAEHNVQTGDFALEAWVNLRNYAVGSSFIAGKELCAGPSIYAMYVSNGGAPSMRLNNSSSTSFFASGPVSGVGLNQWHHLVGTREGSTLRMYLDGVEVGSTALSGTFEAQSASFSIGERPDGLAESCRSLTNGLIDEVTLYDRALNAAEVESIFNAGAGGKLKSVDTPPGLSELIDTVELDVARNVTTNTKWPAFDPVAPLGDIVSVGDVAISFDSVTAGGTTQQIPLTGEGLPPIPTEPASALIYDIATSASYTGNIGLCFNVPSFTTADIFVQLAVVHLEAGNWINRTVSRDFATRTICAQTTSLSPFAIAPIAPTSAPLSVGGRVLMPNGNGIGNAVITLSDAVTGATMVARSSPFGYYRFDGIPWGRTFIAEIRSKSHSFQTPVRTVTAFDDIADLDFIADPLFSSPGSKGSP